MQIIKKAAAIYGWDCPLRTFIYPGFDCGSAFFAPKLMEKTTCNIHLQASGGYLCATAFRQC